MPRIKAGTIYRLGIAGALVLAGAPLRAATACANLKNLSAPQASISFH
jgi:hypothetical protein